MLYFVIELSEALGNSGIRRICCLFHSNKICDFSCGVVSLVTIFGYHSILRYCRMHTPNIVFGNLH